MATTQRIGKCATTVSGSAANLSVTYHSTEVVNVTNGIITLRSGGWHSVTTKLRMNQASNQYGLGFSVYSKRGTWMVSYHGQEMPFSDGMSFGG